MDNDALMPTMTMCAPKDFDNGDNKSKQQKGNSRAGVVFMIRLICLGAIFLHPLVGRNSKFIVQSIVYGEQERTSSSSHQQDSDKPRCANVTKPDLERIIKTDRIFSTRYDYTFRSKPEGDCDMTVALLEPRLAFLPANDTVYTKTLESIGEYVSLESCIVLQISICQLKHCLQHGDMHRSDILFHDDETLSKRNASNRGKFHPIDPKQDCSGGTNRCAMTDQEVLEAAKENIMDRAGRQLKRFFRAGRIRIAVIDPSKYLINCFDFLPNNIWFSAHYWMDEFLPEDNDKVLIIQRDVFLCKPFRNDVWKQFDWVASPLNLGWPWMRLRFTQNKSITFQSPIETENRTYSKQPWIDYWKTMDVHYTEHRKMSPEFGCSSLKEKANSIDCPLPSLPENVWWPKELPKETFRVGNGGYSLRSRKWILRMIRLCPHRVFSGLSDQIVNSAPCSVHPKDLLEEDQYYSVLLSLAGGANLPSPGQASLFAVNQDFPSPNKIIWNDNVVTNLLGDEALQTYKQEIANIGRALPVGYHKCFMTHSPFETNLTVACPKRRFCKYSFHPDE